MNQLLNFILWLAPTIRFRFELGAVSFSFLEPLSILIILIIVALSLKFRVNSKIKVDNVTLMMFIFVIWVSMIRVFGEDLQHNLSDIRDWLIPFLIYISLLSIYRTGWYQRILLFVYVGFVHSLIGIYQHVFNTFRPFATESSLYKTGFVPGSANVSPAFGLFEHPNSLATYLLVALLVGYAWYRLKGYRSIKLIVLFVIGLAFYWTFAKAQMLTFAYIIFLLLLIRISKSPFFFGFLSVTILAIGLLGGWYLMNLYPDVFSTFWWRVELWKSVYQTIAQQPIILLLGNGDALFAQNAIWPQPHNLYFHTILQYGIPGLSILVLMFFFFIRYGILILRRGEFQKYPLLSAIWLCIVGYLVVGLVESSFVGIETRTIFFLIAASFEGLRREIADGNSIKQKELDSPFSYSKNSPIIVRPIN